ncbi:MAG: rhomboid family intramembrane serine protease [Opitutales bacterium]
MRDPLAPQGPSGVMLLLGLMLGGFILQALFGLQQPRNDFNPFDGLNEYFALSLDNLSTGFIWTLVTYAFLHGGFFHLLGNGLGLFFLGRPVEGALGRAQFLRLFAAGVLCGAGCWLTLTTVHYFIFEGLDKRIAWEVPLMGASAGVMSVIIYFCIWRANDQITLLLFFILPVRIKPKYLGWFLFAFDMVNFVVFELRGRPSIIGPSIASTAHLGGMAVGAAVYFLRQRDGGFTTAGRQSQRIEKPRWLTKGRPGKRATPPKQTVNISNRSELRGEVDRILDKINTQGFGSLSDEEKRVLDRARDVLNR